MDSELLFILIIVITAIANIIKAFNKNKKKRNAPAPAVTGEGGGEVKESEWQKILRELMGESDPRPQPVGSDDYDDMGDEGEQVRSRAEELRNKTYRFEEPAFTEPSTKMKGFDVEQSTDSDDIAGIPNRKWGHSGVHNSLKDFDLKSAIIYNAVLNRPY